MVVADAGVENPAVKIKVISNKKIEYLFASWGRVITFSVCRRRRDQ